jgi:TonB family protein
VVIGRGAPLTTRVSVTYRYLGGGIGFYHYAYQLPNLAYRHLDRTVAVQSIPQAIFPPGAASCPDAAPVDSTPITEPAFATGSALGPRIEYTEAARLAEVQGIVYLSAVVTEDGRVPCVEVLSGLPHGLTESAVKALAAATFTPARRGGTPVARRIVLPVRFVMAD